MSNILPRSALAAVNHNNKIKIYYQAYNGQLLETYTDDGTNFYRTKDPLPTPNKPKTFTTISAVGYHECREIRVYYITTEHYLEELAWTDGRGWYPGELNNLKIQTASYTTLAVVHYDEKFRVYYQRASDNKILEVVNDGPNWAQGATLREASPGTKLAAVRTPDGHLRVYYQDRDFRTRQLTSKNGWGDDTEIASARTDPKGSFAILNIFDTATELRLYFPEKENPKKYAEVSNAGGEVQAWSGGQTVAKSIADGNIAAVSWGSVEAIRLYTQTEGNDIQEFKWGQGGNWREGSKIPTV